MTDRTDTLRRLGLMRGEAPEEPLRTLCHHDYLVGGMSIALDVRIDEALGPLLEAMGGAARTLRVLDIRGTAPSVFSVKLDGQQHEWEVDGLESLIDALNIGFAPYPEVKALAQLGEWEEMLQVWALPKAQLVEMLEQDWFRPSNPRALDRAMVH